MGWACYPCEFNMYTTLKKMIKKYKAKVRQSHTEVQKLQRACPAREAPIAARRKWSTDRIAMLQFDPDNLQDSTIQYPQVWDDPNGEGQRLPSGPTPPPYIGKHGRLYIIGADASIVYLT